MSISHPERAMIGNDHPSPLSDPFLTACLALSLLQAEAYEALLGISAPFLRHRYMLSTSTAKDDSDDQSITPTAAATAIAKATTVSSSKDPFSFFQWHPDAVKEVVAKWDAAHDVPAGGAAVYYRVLDGETCHACLPFSVGPRTGVVVLQRVDAATWAYFNILEPAGGLGEYIADWSTSVEAACEKLATQPKRMASTLPAEEKDYWDSYDAVESDGGEEEPEEAPAQASNADGDGEDYWNSYDTAAPSY
ncbi:hypothetical protein DFJ77DRAFT_448923 [Powellomyces hirtus]|nr:hypothetical protein DFJ77DRAFT_448923 [Powellomyces hirtus]